MPARNPPSDVDSRVESFIDKFDAANARTIRACRDELRKLFPTAVELVYDNYNFFVIGYCATAKPSSCIVSLAAAANGVGLSFYRGATLADPDRLLLGEGVQNRFIRLPDADVLRDERVLALIRAAVAQAPTALPPTGPRQTIVQSVSAKQRPRRRPHPFATVPNDR